MMRQKALAFTVANLSVLLCSTLAVAQVQTEVPPVGRRARSRSRWSASRSTGRRSKAIWRGMPSTATRSCSCRRATPRTRPGAIRSSTRCTATPSAPSSGRTRFTCRRPSRAPSPRARKEMIVVLPDSKTVHNGSMYSSSVTTGDFERFVAHDVVAYIDAHYRTIPERASRGLVGHSMGGYGATRIGMKHADVFGSLYIMSPCCLSPRRRRAGRTPDLEKALAAMKTPADAREPAVLHPRAARHRGGLVAQPAESAALSRPADEGRRAAARRPRQVGRERAAGIHRPVHRRPAPVPRDRDRRGRSGRPASRHRQAARGPRQIWHRETFGLPGHAHERGGGPLPEPRDAVLQPEPLLRGALPLVRGCLFSLIVTDALAVFVGSATAVALTVTTAGWAPRGAR